MFMNASFGDGGIDLMHLRAILHKLLSVITKRSCILRSGIFKLTLHFPSIIIFHTYNVFIAHRVSYCLLCSSHMWFVE